MEGINVREHNGILVMRLHYSADPAKRSDEWKESAQQGLSKRDWEREYEINWTIASGLPVYAEEFVYNWHVSKQPLLAYKNLPMYRGWDLGPTHVHPSCVVVQFDPLHRLSVLDAIVVWDGRGEIKSGEVGPFADQVILSCNEWYPEAEWIDYADPSAWTESMTDKKSCITILNSKGIHPRRGPVTFTARKDAMIKRLTHTIQGQPALLVSCDCQMIVEGFQGAYRYEEIGETGRYKASVEKNAWSHPMNALEYVVGALFLPQPSERDDDYEHKRYRGRDRTTGY